MTCTVCDKPITDSPIYISGECQHPLTHAHTTIENIKLPGRVAKIFNRLDSESRPYPAGLTLQERDTLQNTRIHSNDFTTELERPTWSASPTLNISSSSPSLPSPVQPPNSAPHPGYVF